MASLLERFEAAKEQVKNADNNQNTVLEEMVKAGMAKVIEDQDGEFPDMTIVTSGILLRKICLYTYEEGCCSPIWLDAGGYSVPIGEHETVEWF